MRARGSVIVAGYSWMVAVASSARSFFVLFLEFTNWTSLVALLSAHRGSGASHYKDHKFIEFGDLLPEALRETQFDMVSDKKDDSK